MATLVDSFPCLIPHGTALASPITVAIPMQSRIVTGIRIRVPRGPNGVMGFQIGANGQQIIPENTGKFLVADDEIFDWPLTDFPEGGSYQLIGYNTGTYDHTVYVTLLADPITQQVAPNIPAISPNTLSSPAPLPSATDQTAPAASVVPAATVAPVSPSVPPPAIPAPPVVNPPAVGSPTIGAPPDLQPPTLATGPGF